MKYIIENDDVETWCCALIDTMDRLKLVEHNPLDEYDAAAFVMLNARLLEYHPHK